MLLLDVTLPGGRRRSYRTNISCASGTESRRARWGAMASVPEATPQERLLRYNDGAVALHWLTALLVVAQVTVGFTFAGMERGPARGDLFTVPKSSGDRKSVVEGTSGSVRVDLAGRRFITTK